MKFESHEKSQVEVEGQLGYSLQLCSDDLSGNRFIELLRLTALQACAMSSPNKLAATESPRKAKTEHSRKRYILNRKLQKLNSWLQSLRLHNPSSVKIKQLEDQITLIYFDIKDSHNAEHTRQEELTVAKVIENPKKFLAMLIAKRFTKQKSNVGPLYNNDSLTNNP